MKIFVVGANGQIGRHLIKELATSEHQVVAGVRDVATQSFVKDSNVSYVSFVLTWTPEEMAQSFKGSDVLIFTAGSQGKNLLQVDLDGAIKTMIGAEIANVSRYLMISAVFADDRSKWPESMIDYYITKHYADEWLKNRTSLDYVIIQPVSLTNDEEVTPVQLAKPTEETAKTISRKTVAAVLTALVDQPEIKKTTIVVSEGKDDLSSTLKNWHQGE
ncbi:SDR family oxidoreductase [Enterococcus durans]|uniref:SDR family oxidoreductase n=1 Tax=Enterococcus durans TaxID=53345 RepID=UPI00115F742B|nr:SDR family oxidoreductase [Enterococcus durans]MCT4340366.1 SDR family oxidoreductase [Enterococcus durans]